MIVRIKRAYQKAKAASDFSFAALEPAARYRRVRNQHNPFSRRIQQKPGFCGPGVLNWGKTCTGRLYMCLGHEDAADLRTPLRASEGNGLLNAAIREAITRKPKGHDFIIDRSNRAPAVARHMSVTGG
jgi:molybdenum cofactor biosynthesis enzyme MoaA